MDQAYSNILSLTLFKSTFEVLIYKDHSQVGLTFHLCLKVELGVLFHKKAQAGSFEILS